MRKGRYKKRGAFLILGGFLLGIYSSAMADEIDIKLGGELEFEYVDTQPGPATQEADPHFKIDKFYLYPKATFGKDVVFRAEVIFQREKAFVEEAWAKFSGLPLNSWVEAGSNDMFIANIDRKAETEILLENAFYRDDDMGVTIGGAPTAGFYWMASLTNGFKLGSRSPGEDKGSEKSNHLLADVENPNNAPQHLMIGLGAGLKASLGGTSRFDLLPFFYKGKLESEDLSTLQKISGYDKSSADDSKSRYGFNVRYDARRFTLIGQYLRGDDGALNRTGYFLQPSVKVGQYEYVYRYNNIEVDLPKIATDSRTWDRSQHLVALITDLYKGIKLKTEYMLNEEEGAEVPDDEFLMQLEVNF